jgi:uroporphyrin-III C-methyltransferase / precorrin-2 dehydrogenase / sirohydrochlorin ferrochelatase
MSELLPLFLKLSGRSVLLVGGGRVATAKLQQLLSAGARVHVVAPEIAQGIEWAPKDRVSICRRVFVPSDLDDSRAWLVVAAATPEVNREVAEAAESRRIFVNAVDDPDNASAFLSGVVRRDGVTVAISTSGDAPALAALLREGIDALLPKDLAAWLQRARAERLKWRRDAVPMGERKGRLLRVLNGIYDVADPPERSPAGREKFSPWLGSPEDSWL